MAECPMEPPPLSKEELRVVAERAAAATPGPWADGSAMDHFGTETVCCLHEGVRHRVLLTFNHHFAWEADAAFVRHAREDVSRLLATIAKRDATIAKLREAALLRCSFCKKTQREVASLIAGPDTVCICDECIGVANEILTRKRTENAPPAPSGSEGANG